MSNDDLDAFLASDAAGGPVGQRRCRTCADYPHLAESIQEFFQRKATGEIRLPTISLVGAKSLWTFLQSRGYTLSNVSLTRHVTLCLGIDHKTGRPL